MRNIRISDMTMQQQTEAFSLSFKEKIELAKLLDKLGADVIQLEGITNPRVDALRIKSIAAAVREAAVAVPVAPEPREVEPVWQALRGARHPRLQVCAALSSVQMEYIHHKKPDAMVELIARTVAAARALCPEVEFVAVDATRSDFSFLLRAIEAAREAGAGLVTLCDTAGTLLPEEFADFVKTVREGLRGEPELGVACADVLSMADACVIAAAARGICEIKAAAYPVDAPSLGHVSRILCARGDSLGCSCSVRVNQLSRSLEQITRICQAGQGSASPLRGSVREEEELYLTAHDTLENVVKMTEHLGYDLSPEDGVKVFEAFRAIAAKKEQVSTRELDAIVASAAMQVPPTYRLEAYVITSGNTISSTAHMRLHRGEEMLEGVCMGDGPIDAAFLAIEQITGRHYELDDFQIQSVTRGREAMGQTVVRLRSGGRLYSGRGISTDIVGAGISAYLSALNKIAYEEEEQ